MSSQDKITRLAVEKRRTPVIIIDEANYVSNAVLNDLKILFNFDMDSKDRVVILLVGLPQSRTYISEKPKGVGGIPDIFNENAVEVVINAADGTPRMINKLCNASMLIASNREQTHINVDAVMQAVGV